MPKIHTKINHVDSLCGKSADKVTIVSNAEFAKTPAADRCYSCSVQYQKKGYKITLPEKSVSEKAKKTQAAVQKRRAFMTHLMMSCPD